MAAGGSFDFCDTVQLLIFIRGNVTENLAELFSLKWTSTVKYIYIEIYKTLKKFNVSWQKLTGVTTYGDKNMSGINTGLIGQMNIKMTKKDEKHLWYFIAPYISRSNMLKSFSIKRCNEYYSING